MRRTTGLVLILVCLTILIHDAGSGRMSTFRKAYCTDDLNQALLESAERRAWDKARVLVERGADVNMDVCDGDAPCVPFFCVAVPNAPGDFIELCIDAGADINAKNRRRGTALGWAVGWNRFDVAALLLTKGADINERDGYGSTLLHNASHRGLRGMVEFLILHGADVDARICCDESLLHEGHLYTIGDNGWTPLHQAAFHGHTEVALVLINAGAGPNAKDRAGRTPLDWAIQQKHDDVAELLRRHGGKTAKELGQ